LKNDGLIGVDYNPVSLLIVKAGYLLSTLSHEVWLQGEGRRYHPFVLTGDGELQDGMI
jgi:hypothetical protein